ncbi:MAG: hypothetical protein AAGM67_06400, partial [Bacteroidota bacterium]
QRIRPNSYGAAALYTVMIKLDQEGNPQQSRIESYDDFLAFMEPSKMQIGPDGSVLFTASGGVAHFIGICNDCHD